MKSKLKIIIPLALVIAGGAYKFVLAKPAPGPPKKVDGQVYILPKEFLVNLKDTHFAKVNVALVVADGVPLAAAAGGEGSAAAKVPDGYGTLPEEPVIRSIITDTLTGSKGATLTSRKGRLRIKSEILRAINKETDVKTKDVLLMDVAVQ